MAAVTSEQSYSSGHKLKLSLDVTKFSVIQVKFEAYAEEHGWLKYLGEVAALEKPTPIINNGKITNQAAITAYETDEKLRGKCWNALVQLCDGVKDAIPRKYAKDANKCQKTWEEIQMKVRNGREANDTEELLRRFQSIKMIDSGDSLKDLDNFTEEIELMAIICNENKVVISDDAKAQQFKRGVLPQFDGLT